MSKKKIDKRTKAYKDSIKNKPAKGLGDIVEDITKATGIKKAVKAIFGDDCGCEERKKKLNRIDLPRRFNAVRCLDEEQYNEYKEYIQRRTLAYSAEDARLLVRLFAHVFAVQYNSNDLCMNCTGSFKILKKLSDNLDIVFNSYKDDI